KPHISRGLAQLCDAAGSSAWAGSCRALALPAPSITPPPAGRPMPRPGDRPWPCARPWMRGDSQRSLSMSHGKIVVEHLYKVFGPDPQQAIRLLEQGHDKDRILAETGNVIGVDRKSVV